MQKCSSYFKDRYICFHSGRFSLHFTVKLMWNVQMGLEVKNDWSCSSTHPVGLQTRERPAADQTVTLISPQWKPNIFKIGYISNKLTTTHVSVKICHLEQKKLSIKQMFPLRAFCCSVITSIWFTLLEYFLFLHSTTFIWSFSY